MSCQCEAYAEEERKLGAIAIVFRSIIDLFYILHIIFKFRSRVACLSSKVPEIRVEICALPWRFFMLYSLVDIFFILPLPQRGKQLAGEMPVNFMMLPVVLYIVMTTPEMECIWMTLVLQIPNFSIMEYSSMPLNPVLWIQLIHRLQYIILHTLCTKDFLLLLVGTAKPQVGVGLMVLQQFGGVNGIAFYPSTIFISAGFSDSVGTIAMVVVQVPNFLPSTLVLAPDQMLENKLNERLQGLAVLPVVQDKSLGNEGKSGIGVLIRRQIASWHWFHFQ